MFKSLQASSNINFSWSPTLWKFGSCLDIQIERWSNWDTEPELPCEVLMRIHLLHSSFTSNICESSKSSQEYLAFLSYQNYQQSCFVTNQSKSVSPLDGLRDIERPSLPSFLWHYAFDLKDGAATVLAFSWDLKSWSWTCPDLGEAWHTNPADSVVKLRCQGTICIHCLLCTLL